MTIYGRIKELAEQQKLSIRSLEEKLGYGNGTIRRWEKQVPGVDKVQKVADYFNVSVDYLLGREDTAEINDNHLKVVAAHIDDDATEEEINEILNFIDFVQSKRGK